MGERTIQLLAYQYRDLNDGTYKNGDRQKFLDFLAKLDLNIKSDEKKKVFSYPDLYVHTPSHNSRQWLVDQFAGKLTGVTLKETYVVHVKKAAQHIGFTASVVFVMEMDDPTDDSIRRIFVPERGKTSCQFHQDFEKIWAHVAGRKESLPVVLFRGDTREFLWDAPTSSKHLVPSPVSVFGSPISVALPSGRSVRVQRGFPYVTYVIHADVGSVMPEEIHHCDFALLMALPGFVEERMQRVREYRAQLRCVQQLLEADNFDAAQNEYNKAWKDFETVQGLAPTTTAAVQRILQKYSVDSIFASIAKDNSQLIEFTITAAIAATDQVRSNIYSYAQQKLQKSLVTLTESTRDLQKDSVNLTKSIKRAGVWTAVATLLLAATSLITVCNVFREPPSTKTQLTRLPEEPIRVITEPASPAKPTTPVALKIISKLYEGQYPITPSVVLTSAKNASELIGDVPTTLATLGASPIEIAIIQADGSVIARNSVTSEKVPVAIRFAANKDLFVEGQQYHAQVSQSSVWTLKLPITIVSK